MLELAMLFSVSGLMQEGIGATREHDVQGSLRTEGRAPERVLGSVELLRTKAGVLVRAHLRVAVSETCSRCLRPLEETLPIDFEEEFQATVDLRTGASLADKPQADTFLIDSQHILDLQEAVRQYREASEEMQPLCRPECRGLCPRCGRDLNSGDCGCRTEARDPRWQSLSALASAGARSAADGATSKGKD